MTLTSCRQTSPFYFRFCLLLFLFIITFAQSPAQYRHGEILSEGGVPEGSLILMADGSEKPIEKIQAGDILAAYDPAIEQIVSTTVLRKESFSDNLQPSISLILVQEELSASLQVSGGTLGIILEANAQQPLLTQWGKKEASQLQEGDQVYAYDESTGRFHLFTVYELLVQEQSGKTSFQLITDKQNCIVNGVVLLGN